MAGPKYTKREDAVILKCVKKSPTNITEAIRNAATALGRSEHSVRVRYYKYLQKEQKNHILFTLSSRKRAKNYKVTRLGARPTQYNPEDSNLSKWKRILAILFE